MTPERPGKRREGIAALFLWERFILRGWPLTCPLPVKKERGEERFDRFA
jgi:hypothetical protein